MKVEDNKRTGAAQAIGPVARKATGNAEKTARAPAPVQPAVVTEVMGIPEAEFTPKVRAAIMALMEEVDKLRREVQQSQSRIAYLEQLADQDSLMPIANRRAFVRELSRMMSFAERYDTQRLIEVVFTVGGYTMTGLAINSFGIQVEDGYAGFPGS